MHKDEKVIINIRVGLSTPAVRAQRSFIGSRSIFQTVKLKSRQDGGIG